MIPSALAITGLITLLQLPALLNQNIWSETGLKRVLAFTTIYGSVVAFAVLFNRRSLLPLSILIGLIACFASGAGLALLATSFIGVSAYGTGKLLNAPTPLLRVLTGLACIATLYGILAHFSTTLIWVPLLVAAAYGVRSVRLPKFDASPMISVLSLPMLFSLFAALKPEISFDGLAMHLVAPTTVAWSKSWSFDPGQFTWGLMPMNADWLYSLVFELAGEPASRLLNFGVLLLLVGLLYELSGSMLIAAVFASTPLVLLVTGSLFVENFWTVCVLGAFACLVKYRDGRSGGILLGAALASKLLAGAYVPAIAGLYLWHCRHKLREAASFAGITALVAAPPYLTALIRTGNPVFPLFNTLFRSPFYDMTGALQDGRFVASLKLLFPYDITFHTRQYLEGLDGAVGIAWFLLLPAGLLLLLRKQGAPAATLVLLSAGLITITQPTNARYLYGLLPFAALVMTPLAAKLSRAFPILAIAAIVMNLYLYPSSGGYHRDLFLLSAQEREAYIQNHAPGKALVAYLNRTHNTKPVAFFGNGQIAGLHGKAYMNSWHTYPFLQALLHTRDEEGVFQLLESYGIDSVVAEIPETDKDFQPLHLKPFLQRWVNRETTSGDYMVGHIERPSTLTHLLPLTRGTYDDANDAIKYSGSWTRARTFTRTYGNSVAYGDQQGDSFSFTLQGEALQYTYTKAPNRGIARMTIDNTRIQELDLYSPKVEWQTTSRFELGPGPHSITIAVTGRKNPQSSGTFVDLDKLTVE